MPQRLPWISGMRGFRAVLAASVLSTGLGLVTRFGTELDQYSFSHFVKEYGRTYEQGTEEWTKRESIFNQRMQEVKDFRAGPSRSWTQGVTRFMDYTVAEYTAMLGYKGRRSATVGAVQFFSRRGEIPPQQLPAFVDAGSNTSLGSLVRDQGSCGSCWAEASVSVLESHMEKNPQVLAALTDAVKSQQPIPTLSSQTLVSCTPNPRNCGGHGGCSGATAELAFDLVMQRGLPLAVKWGYVSGSGFTPNCRDDIFHSIRVGITGYEVLPSNEFGPLKRGLVNAGPIVASVDATNWAFYTSGIFSDTAGGRPGDFTVNHAVTLMGFKEPTNGKRGYWLIKNSWGGSWGERGYIRLEMKENEEEHCGWDYRTKDGLACDGDPDTAWVCGTCGILYDSSYPTGVHLMPADSS